MNNPRRHKHNASSDHHFNNSSLKVRLLKHNRDVFFLKCIGLRSGWNTVNNCCIYDT